MTRVCAERGARSGIGVREKDPLRDFFRSEFARVAAFILSATLNSRAIAMDDDDKPTPPMSPEASRALLDRVLKVIERGGSSPCFWWFYDRYENIRTADGKLRMTWRECCASLTAIGVTAMDGRPLTPETTRKTWRKVVERKRRDAVCGYQSPYSKAERGTAH